MLLLLHCWGNTFVIKIKLKTNLFKNNNIKRKKRKKLKKNDDEITICILIKLGKINSILVTLIKKKQKNKRKKIKKHILYN